MEEKEQKEQTKNDNYCSSCRQQGIYCAFPGSKCFGEPCGCAEGTGRQKQK